MMKDHPNDYPAKTGTATGGTAALLKSPAAAAFLGICERKLWSLTNCGDIRAVRIGRAVRYAPEDLEFYVARQKTGLTG